MTDEIPRPTPLTDAMVVLGARPLTVSAPDWAVRGRAYSGWMLFARSVLALLLLAFSASFLFQLTEDLPGESSLAPVVKRLDNVATGVDQAREAKVDARETLTEAKETLEDVKNSQDPGREALRTARAAKAEARTNLDDKVERVQARSRQYVRLRVDLMAMRQTSTDADLVRGIGLGLMSLVALVGAVALLAPRSSQLLSVAHAGAPVPDSGESSDPDGPDDPEGLQQGAPDTEATVTQKERRSFVGNEPALAQSVVGAGVIIAALFGIQEFEGVREAALNVVITAVPIIGALFARGRVVPRAHLTDGEWRRLFSKRPPVTGVRPRLGREPGTRGPRSRQALPG